MESKIIKVKTDGDIQRDAHVVSGFDVDGSEYVIYYIDRDDNEHDLRTYWAKWCRKDHYYEGTWRFDNSF